MGECLSLLTYWRLKLWIEEDRPLYPAVIFDARLFLAYDDSVLHSRLCLSVLEKADYHPYEILLPVVCFSLINTGLLLSVRFEGPIMDWSVWFHSLKSGQKPPFHFFTWNISVSNSTFITAPRFS